MTWRLPHDKLELACFSISPPQRKESPASTQKMTQMTYRIAVSSKQRVKSIVPLWSWQVALAIVIVTFWWYWHWTVVLSDNCMDKLRMNVNHAGMYMQLEYMLNNNIMEINWSEPYIYQGSNTCTHVQHCIPNILGMVQQMELYTSQIELKNASYWI